MRFRHVRIIPNLPQALVKSDDTRMEEVPAPKDEGISCLRFSPCDSATFMTTSWSGALRIYSCESKTEMIAMQLEAPLLCGAWASEDVIAAGSMNGPIFLSSGQTLVGHSDGVSMVGVIPSTTTLVSASWDKTIRIWDLSSQSNTCTITLSERVLSAEVAAGHKVVAHGSNSSVFICDIRNPEQIEKRVSSLGYQIRSSCASRPAEYGWAIGSIDGRIAIEYFGDVCEQAQRFSFSCCRRDEENNVVVYPVNALTFHPKTGVLTSGSCNGDICFWDIESKRKLAEIPSPFGVSVASMDYNASGDILAIAYSYTWDKGEIEHPDDKIVLHTPSANSVTPRKTAHE